MTTQAKRCDAMRCVSAPTTLCRSDSKIDGLRRAKMHLKACEYPKYRRLAEFFSLDVDVECPSHITQGILVAIITIVIKQLNNGK